MSSVHSKRDTSLDVDERHEDVEELVEDDAEFGGTEARKKLERKLLWKVDLRMSILIVIYILNYVRRSVGSWLHAD